MPNVFYIWLVERAGVSCFQELLLDSDTIADKILKNQHFHKASKEEREQIVTGILAKGPAGALVTKMAHAVADKHETYRQASSQDSESGCGVVRSSLHFIAQRIASS